MADEYRLFGIATRANPALATFTTPLLAAARLFTQNQTNVSSSTSSSSTDAFSPHFSNTMMKLKSLTQRQWKRVFETHPRLVGHMLIALGLAVCKLTEPTCENLQLRIWSKQAKVSTATIDSVDKDESALEGVGKRDPKGGFHGLEKGPGLSSAGTSSSVPNKSVVGVGRGAGGGGGGVGGGGQGQRGSGGMGPVDVIMGRCLVLVREALAAWSSHHGRWTHGAIHPLVYRMTHTLSYTPFHPRTHHLTLSHTHTHTLSFSLSHRPSHLPHHNPPTNPPLPSPSPSSSQTFAVDELLQPLKRCCNGHGKWWRWPIQPWLRRYLVMI